MERRVSFLVILSFLMFAEALSWLMAGGLGPCLVHPEHTQQAADHDNHQDCPTFFAGTLLVFERGADVLKRNENDKAVVAGFTIVLAISTIGLWLATNRLWRAGERQFELLAETSAASIAIAKDAADAALKQTEAMQRQLVLMETDQRPWLKAQFEILKPLVFDAKGLQLTLSGKTLNVGKFPAFNAQLYPLIVTNVADAAKSQKELCENIRNSRRDKSGLIIFPGDHITNSPITRGFSPEEINNGKTMLRFDSPDVKGDLLGIVITGCIVYSLPGHKDSAPRMTGFGYLLRQSKGLGLDTGQETIPVDEITAFILPELSWAD